MTERRARGGECTAPCVNPQRSPRLAVPASKIAQLIAHVQRLVTYILTNRWRGELAVTAFAYHYFTKQAGDAGSHYGLARFTYESFTHRDHNEWKALTLSM